MITYGADREGEREAHHQRRRDHPRTLEMGLSGYSAFESAGMGGRGDLAETMWKWDGICGKVCVDGRRMTIGGLELLRDPGSGFYGRTEAYSMAEGPNEIS